ncbi:hypothetical protein GCM10022408_37880 [Hymenobacter fastidiosus]|uniref:Uncharacterized protein n=1 Tax=Hymenobacter fastidiosus TaxID=486264 RepID=A0ABP7T374_9BACT
MPFLTTTDLDALLSAVPVPIQQRDEAVRLQLRADLPADYCGPVTLQDVRLTLSPWHWLGGELAHSPRSESLSQALTEARATGADDLDTVEEVADWVSQELAATDLDWYTMPGDSAFWGEWGPADEAEAETGSFLPPGVALPAVLFFIDSGSSQDERLVVAQGHWQQPNDIDAGSVGIYASSRRVAAAGSAYPQWLMGWGALLLTDPATGEQAELSPRWTEEDDLGELQLVEWQGREPRFEADTLLSSDPGVEPDWLRGKLHYAAGRLVRADTGQALTLTLHMLPEPPPTDRP